MGYFGLLLLLLSGMIVFMFFFATHLNKDIIPDENYHIKFIEFYKNNNSINPIVGKQEEYFEYGEFTRSNSYMYHYIFGNLQKFISFNDQVSNIIFLRLINVFLGVATLILTISVYRLLIKDRLLIISSLTMLGGSLMFIVLQSGVNYDNLANLIAILSIFLLIKLFLKPSLLKVLLFILLLVIGPLVKFTLIPLFVFELLFLFLFYYKNRKEIIPKYKELKNDWKKYYNILLMIIILISSFLLVERYVGNFVKYESILTSPSCIKVTNKEECENNPQFIRDNSLKRIDQSITLTGTVYYLQKWSISMIDKTIGITAHKYIQSNPYLLLAMSSIIFISALCAIRYFDFRINIINCLFIITLLYVITLAMFNYSSYLRYGIFELALQGRYLFLVLPLIYFYINYYIFKIFRTNIIKIIYTIFVILLFTYGGFYWFTQTSTPDWFLDENKKLYIISTK